MGVTLDNTTGTLKLNDREVMLEEVSGNDNISGLINVLEDYSVYFDDIPSKNGTAVETPQGVNLSKGRTVALHTAYDTVARTFTGTTAWYNGKTWTNYGKLAGSKMMLYWKVASRNDNASWGGSGINILYSVDGGTVWTSWASSTYAGGCMVSSAASIASQNGNCLLDVAAINNATQIRIKFQHRAYTAGSTLTVNGSHSITTGATGFGYSHIMMQEISTV